VAEAPDKKTYFTIDGLRGLAALLVVTRHTIPLHGGHLTTASSYLAVELFFLFSGFVIAHAYDKRFAQGLGFWEFARLRVIRLYPLYFLALCIAILTIPGARLAGIKHTWPLNPGVIAWGLLMLPTFAGIYGPLVYPFNNPSWTLFFELTANFVYALVWRGLSNGVLILLIIASAAGLAATDLHFHSLDVGYTRQHFIGGFGRVFFSFFAGVGLYRFHRAYPCPVRISPWLLMFGCFWLLVAWPHRGMDRTAYDMACALVVFPVFGYLATAVEPGPTGQRLFAFGGGLSYGLYLLHSPLGGVLNQFFVVFGRPKGSPLLWVVFVLFAGLFAWLAERYFDRPARRWLASIGKPKPRDLPVQPAGAS
jgi:peptidoglycan/LPS O-acetylase OafA/YrhL